MTTNPLGPSTRGHGPTTNRIRRHPADHDPPPGRIGATPLVPAPPPIPDPPPRPLGELSTTPIQGLVVLAGASCGSGRTGVCNSRRGTRRLLEELARFPGATWQQRWEAAGLNQPGRCAAELGGTDRTRQRLVNTAAAQASACA